MRYKDLIEGKDKAEPVLNEDDGGGATTSGDIATNVGFLGTPAKKGKKAKPVVLRRPK